MYFLKNQREFLNYQKELKNNELKSKGILPRLELCPLFLCIEVLKIVILESFKLMNSLKDELEPH